MVATTRTVRAWRSGRPALMNMYQTLSGVSRSQDAHVVDKAGLLAERVEHLAVYGVDIDRAVVFGVEDHGVEGTCGDLS
jgi:hypothetical protein